MSQQYDFAPAAGLNGQIADLAPRYVRSMSNEGVGVPFGIAVKRGTGDSQFEPLAAAGDEVIGILSHSHARDVLGLVEGEDVRKGDVGNVVAQGTVYVRVEDAVTPADPVFVRFADGVAVPTNKTRGAFGKAADTNTAKELVGARYLTSAAAGELALVWFSAQVESLSATIADFESRITDFESRITDLENA